MKLAVVALFALLSISNAASTVDVEDIPELVTRKYINGGNN